MELMIGTRFPSMDEQGFSQREKMLHMQRLPFLA